MSTSEDLLKKVANADLDSPREFLLAKNMMDWGLLENPRTLAQFAEFIRSCGFRVVAETDAIKALQILNELDVPSARVLEANSIEVKNHWKPTARLIE